MLNLDFEVRSIDGTGNNTQPERQDWGAAGEPLDRLLDPAYADDVSALAGADRPNPRDISNAVFMQSGDMPIAEGYSDLLTVWGQFLAHDIDLTPDNGSETAPVAVPTGDSWFDPLGFGGVEIPFHRSGFVEGTGTDPDNPREHPNVITGYIDASMVYGSDAEREAFLRDEGGRLKVSDGNLLPFNDPDDPIDNAGANGDTSFVAGDVRANENVVLLSLHTTFVNEHNYQVERLAAEDPGASAEWLYQKAKMFVEAEIQHITYEEFLPKLVGEGALPAYEGYDPDMDPSVLTEFTTAAFRLGHSLVSPTIHRLEEDGSTIADGNLALHEGFFSPERISDEGGVEPVLRGLATGTAQDLDAQIIDGLRNFLFGPPGAGGLDLASLNIQRGRDHGLPSYNEYRQLLGFDAADGFDDITADPTVQAQLAAVYGSPDEMDLWVGGLAEDDVAGAIVGPVFHAILVEQFTRLRDGDRFWYENDRFTADELEMIRSTSFADVITRTSTVHHLQDDAFLAYARIGGGEGDDVLNGGVERDLLLGFDGDDTLRGKQGDDDLTGGGGGDLLIGGRGEDVLRGSDGDDSAHGGMGDDKLVGSAGRDTVNGGAGDDVMDGGSGDDRLDGRGGGDTILGGTGDDTVSGDGGRDVLMGGEGADTVLGGAGCDYLTGGDGDDVLDGGDGPDLLRGGAGDDEMAGGSGADRFVIAEGEHVGGGSRDVIVDWDATDRILLAGGPTFGVVSVAIADLEAAPGGAADDVLLTLSDGHEVAILNAAGDFVAQAAIGPALHTLGAVDPQNRDDIGYRDADWDPFAGIDVEETIDAALSDPWPVV